MLCYHSDEVELLLDLWLRMFFEKKVIHFVHLGISYCLEFFVGIFFVMSFF